MALTVQTPTAAEADRRAAELLEQLADKTVQDSFLSDLQHRVASFERQYELRSEDVSQAINSGQLAESHEVCQWLLDYKMLLRLGAR